MAKVIQSTLSIFILLATMIVMLFAIIGAGSVVKMTNQNQASKQDDTKDTHNIVVNVSQPNQPRSI